MSNGIVNKKIKDPYYYHFKLDNSGLVAIFISARCKDREDLRVEINGLGCREIGGEKYKQLFDVPSAFNGARLKGLKKTVVFLTVLQKGEHIISLIPKESATIEYIKIQEFTGQQNPVIDIEEKAEDGDRRPWYTFVLLDLPLNNFTIEATFQKRFLDSDDIKIIVNGIKKRNFNSTKFKFWYIAGALLSWLIPAIKGESKRIKESFSEKSDTGVHCIEFYSDRMPILHSISFDLTYAETEAEKRAANLVKKYSNFIKRAGQEFEVNSVIVGAVIYQEQSTNVNFVDALTDYIGGVLGLNTSIGVGQVRVATAAALENYYEELKLFVKENLFSDLNTVRVEMLKDPQTNVRYVAAKIHFSEKRWRDAGYDISDKPEILGTLYNIEDVNQPIEPHDNSEPNEFGKGVKRNLDKVKTLLGL